MPPLKLSKRERNLLLITLICALAYVFYQFLLTPKWEEIDKLNSKVRKLRLELGIVENKIKILEALEKSFKQKPAKQVAPLATEERALEVLRTLAQTTTKSQLQLISIKPMIGLTDQLKFELSCNGTYQQLYDFLRILHSSDILIMIDTLNIIGAAGTDPQLDIKMNLTAHY